MQGRANLVRERERKGGREGVWRPRVREVQGEAVCQGVFGKGEEGYRMMQMAHRESKLDRKEKQGEKEIKERLGSIEDK